MWGRSSKVIRIKELQIIGFIHETDKALLLEDINGEFWIPKAMIISSCDTYIEVYAKFNISYLPKQEPIEVVEEKPKKLKTSLNKFPTPFD